jgi:hypothetical protein
MSELPIKSIAVYKHGIAFYTRRAETNSKIVKLNFPKKYMDDILKSITTIDYGKGQILGIDFDTSEDKNSKLSKSRIDLGEENNLIHLLKGIQGKKISIHANENILQGTLLGLDETKADEIWATKKVSILEEDYTITIVSIGDIKNFKILDGNSANDLKYYLDTISSNELNSEISIRLDDNPHDLMVSYIAPAPIWTVNYRFVCGKEGKGFLQGWALFHNSLDENLENVKFSFITGMPISFVYKLYESFTPLRPEVEEEVRTLDAPIEFSSAQSKKKFSKPSPAPSYDESIEMEILSASEYIEEEESKVNMNYSNLNSVNIEIESKDREESFQYSVKNAVSIERGKSGMIPILSRSLEFSKEYIYNQNKNKNNPTSVLRFKNSSDLILEKGPLLVLDEEGYLGEGILDYTTRKGEAIIAYAIDLSVTVVVNHNSYEEDVAFGFQYSYFKSYYLLTEVTEYKLSNSDSKAKKVIIEYSKKNSNSEFIETTNPKESIGNLYRFEIFLEPNSETSFYIKERQKKSISKRFNLSLNDIENYFKNKLLSLEEKNTLILIFKKYSDIDEIYKNIEILKQTKEEFYKRQTEVRKNIDTLKLEEEKTSRNKFVQELLKLDEKILSIDSEIPNLQSKIKEIELEIESIKLGKNPFGN